MSTMTKRDIALKVADKTGMTQRDAAEVVNQTLNVIVDSLSAGAHIELRGFGVFEIVTQKGRIGRNPNNPGVAIPIPPRKVVKFRAGQKLAQNVFELND